MQNRPLLALAFAAVAVAGLSTNAMAETHWQRAHPRRAEINHRLANQDRRIRNEVREGEITRTQAARLHRQDRHIRREERAMASRNGGGVSKGEQRALNQQENAVSQQIGK
jgi:hypothetical protein